MGAIEVSGAVGVNGDIGVSGVFGVNGAFGVSGAIGGPWGALWAPGTPAALGATAGDAALPRRSGSALERRAITPPVGSPVGRPLYVPPEKTALSLDKIAKRECKVLVVAPVQ